MPTPPTRTRDIIVSLARAWRMLGSNLPVAAGPEMLADRALEHLADAAPRQLGPELDRLGRLDAAQPELDQRLQLLGGARGAGLQLDHRDRRLAPFFVGHADDRAVLHRVVRPQHLLD